MEIASQACVFGPVFVLVVMAFALDISCGDPRLFFLPWKHPVCYVGDFLQRMEKFGRWCITQNKGQEDNACDQKIIGAFCLLVVVLVTAFVAHFLANIPYIGWIIAVYLAYTGLAAGGLVKTSLAVLAKVEHAPLPEAQAALAQLVSRDTAVLDRPALRKSLADTLAENVTDAVVAPLFWLLVGSFGGPACAVATLWAYKAVSTADSMWGYKTKQWINLGYAAAKADDVLAYIPARLSVVFLWITHFFTKTHYAQGGQWPGFCVIAKQAGGMQSPNSGWSMAACAWLLGAGLGGPTQYFGSMVQKPWVGQSPIKDWNEKKLYALAQLVQVTACVAFACLLFVWCVLYFLL